MGDKCNCGPSCPCKKVTIKDKVYIEKAFISAKAKNLATCMKYLEDFCKEKGYEMDGSTLNYYTVDSDKVKLNLYARRVVDLGDK